MNDFMGREFGRFVFVQPRVAKLEENAMEYPPMQKPASFNFQAAKEQGEAAIVAPYG